MPTGHYPHLTQTHEEWLITRLRNAGGSLAARDICTLIRHRLSRRGDVYALLSRMVATGQLVESTRNGGLLYSLPPEGHEEGDIP